MIRKKCFLLVLIFFLAGCQKAQVPIQPGLDIRSQLQQCGGCRFNAVIDADYGDRLYSFSVACVYLTDGSASIHVLQPEEIAGIQATVTENGTSVEFQDMHLEFGAMAGHAISPVSACHVLGRCWAGAYIANCGTDGKLHRITYLDGYDEQELVVDTWCDDDRTPLYAEISCQGKRYLTAEISDYMPLEENETG